MKRQGKVKTQGTVDGKTLNVNWNVMDVKVPILSVRRLCHDHHDLYVAFNYQGGYIFNVQTGERIPIFEHHGVYYLKMKFSDPIHTESRGTVNEPVFSRPVTA